MAPPDPVIQLISVDCPLCGGAKHRVWLRTDDLLGGIPGSFTVARCEDCGHRFMNPRPVDEDLAACYPSTYGPHQTAPANIADRRSDESNTEGSRPWYLRYLPLRRIPGLRTLYYWLMNDHSQPVRESEGSREALEIGCATGLYLDRLRRLGWNVTGIEPSDAAARIARSAGLHVQTGTLDSVMVSSSKYDLAAAWMVLEHVPAPRATLMQLHTALRPGGTLMLSVPNAGCWEAFVFGKFWFGWEPPRHLQHFTPSTLRKLLEECGYTDVRILHQANLSYVVGSLGLRWLAWFPQSRVGSALKAYPANPTTAGKLLLALPAKILCGFRQAGRITVTAKCLK